MTGQELIMKTTRQDNIRLFFSVILALVFTAYLNVAHSEQTRHHVHKVNGSIQIAESEIAANVSTVNGSIRISDYADVADVSTVNGGVQVSSNSAIRSAETVNGSIRLGEQVTVRDSLTTVNGSIKTDRSTQIGEDVSTVNGSIELVSTTVAGNVSTVNGSVRVLSDSVIEGRLSIEKNKSRTWLPMFKRTERNPTIEIGAGSRVNHIYLGREVDLIIHDTAVVGSIDRDY
jgi:DUF4097 and DUF4098 domain-containing protein YvlB